MMIIASCCESAMREVDEAGTTKQFLHHGTDERGLFLVTGYECNVCTQKWERHVETQDPNEIRWDALG